MLRSGAEYIPPVPRTARAAPVPANAAVSAPCTLPESRVMVHTRPVPRPSRAAPAPATAAVTATAPCPDPGSCECILPPGRPHHKRSGRIHDQAPKLCSSLLLQHARTAPVRTTLLRSCSSRSLCRGPLSANNRCMSVLPPPGPHGTQPSKTAVPATVRRHASSVQPLSGQRCTHTRAVAPSPLRAAWRELLPQNQVKNLLKFPQQEGRCPGSRPCCRRSAARLRVFPVFYTSYEHSNSPFRLPAALKRTG